MNEKTKIHFVLILISRISWVEEGAIGILQHLPLKTDSTIDY